MPKTLTLALAFVAVVCAFRPAAASPAPEAITRTLYVTVTDSKGAPVADLTAADFAVKEGGKAREIAKAEKATAKMRTALMVDERLIGDGAIRNGIYEFMKRMVSSSEFALIVVGLRNETVVDYTSDLNTMAAAINKFTLNPGRVSNISESVLDVSRKIAQARPERPVIVVVGLPGEGEVGSGPVNETLNALRQSRAVLSAVTMVLATGGGEQILEEGAKQSGGRRVEIGVTTAIPKALQQIADDLSAQYVITYTVPDGVKPDKRVSVSLNRKGLALRAPTAVPDK